MTTTSSSGSETAAALIHDLCRTLLFNCIISVSLSLSVCPCCSGVWSNSFLKLGGCAANASYPLDGESHHRQNIKIAQKSIYSSSRALAYQNKLKISRQFSLSVLPKAQCQSQLCRRHGRPTSSYSIFSNERNEVREDVDLVPMTWN